MANCSKKNLGSEMASFNLSAITPVIGICMKKYFFTFLFLLFHGKLSFENTSAACMFSTNKRIYISVQNTR